MRVFLLPLLLCSFALADSGHVPAAIYSSGQMFELDGETFPEWVNLARKFRAEIPQQGPTGTCASFATVALMEAACQIDLSEAYVIARHMARNLEIYSIHPSELGLNNRLLSTDVESGNPFRILEEMFKDGLRLEEEWKYEQEFTPFMRKMKDDLLREFRNAKGTFTEVSQALTGRIKTQLAEQTDLKAAAAPQAKAQECLEKLAPPQRVPKGSPLAAMRLLANGINFVCVGGGGRYKEHAYLVMGYRRNENARSGREWLVRDSALPEDPAKWVEMSEYSGSLCGEIAYVVPKSQESIVALVDKVEEKAKAIFAKLHPPLPPPYTGLTEPNIPPPGAFSPGNPPLGPGGPTPTVGPGASPQGFFPQPAAPGQIPSLPR